jgi:hypothetical protein
MAGACASQSIHPMPPTPNNRIPRHPRSCSTAPTVSKLLSKFPGTHCTRAWYPHTHSLRSLQSAEPPIVRLRELLSYAAFPGTAEMLTIAMAEHNITSRKSSAQHFQNVSRSSLFFASSSKVLLLASLLSPCIQLSPCDWIVTLHSVFVSASFLPTAPCLLHTLIPPTLPHRRRLHLHTQVLQSAHLLEVVHLT